MVLDNLTPHQFCRRFLEMPLSTPDKVSILLEGRVNDISQSINQSLFKLCFFVNVSLSTKNDPVLFFVNFIKIL